MKYATTLKHLSIGGLQQNYSLIGVTEKTPTMRSNLECYMLMSCDTNSISL